MAANTSDLSRDKPKKSMLADILKESNLNYVSFAAYLGISRNTLIQYRKGLREFRLSWEQIIKLESLLKKIGKQLSDLPPGWILEETEEKTDEEKTDRTK